MAITQFTKDDTRDSVEEAARQRFLFAYRESYAPLYRYVRFRVGDADLAEDLTAAVFERALRKLATVQQHDRLRPWLFTMARRAVADHFRHHHQTTNLDQVDEREELHVPSPEQEAEQREEFRQLLTCLAALPEREREVLGLRYVAELPHREIARILGLSEANVAQIAHRARARVQRRFSEECSHE